MLKTQSQYARAETTDVRWTKVNGTYSGNPIPGILGPVVTRQSTVTEGHPVSLLGKVPGNIGGFFQTTKTEYRESGAGPYNFYMKGGIIERGVDKGYAYPTQPPKGTSFPVAAQPSSFLELCAAGATAIARTIPTNPHADISSFLGELREGLPSVVGRTFAKRPGLHASADEYLNWQFGLLPMLSDFQKFGQSFINQEKILRQLINDSGKRVRRRYAFPDETTVTTLDEVVYSFPAYDANLHVGKGVRTTTTKTTTKRWFSGCYSYHFPEGDALLAEMQGFLAKANVLAGLPSVETMWNLAPWSWAVDWFSNVGDVFHNFAAFARDGLVMHYGYIMETRKIEQTVTFRGSMMVANAPMPVASTQVFTSTCKIRVGASPFGFGLTDADLSLRQKAIAAALGISKAL